MSGGVGSGAAEPPYADRLGLRCPCGIELVARGHRALIDTVNAHLDAQHPRVARAYDDADILSLSYRKPG